MTNLKLLGGWHRLWLVLAVIWLIPVLITTITHIPKQSESEIKSEWVNEKLNLIKSERSLQESLPDLRQRIYGNKTDDEIIRPTNEGSSEGSSHFDSSTAVPIEKAMQIDERYEAKLDNLKKQSIFEIVGFGLLAWIVPLATIYLLGMAIRWVIEGFRKK